MKTQFTINFTTSNFLDKNTEISEVIVSLSENNNKNFYFLMFYNFPNNIIFVMCHEEIERANSRIMCSV